MKMTHKLLVVFFFISGLLAAQTSEKYDLKIGLAFQKVEGLYWENGIAADLSSDYLLKKKLHLKFHYLSSRLGSAMGTNAILQDNFIIGADWRFRSEKSLQIAAGFNAGLFVADYESDIFDGLPKASMLLAPEAGLYYQFKFPVSAGIVVGYNLINGNGVNVPGTLFPVYYRLSVLYNL